MRSAALTASIAAASVLGLAACSTPQDLALFRQQQTDADRLPDGADRPGGIDEDTTRFLAEADGFNIYAARDEEGSTCVVVVDAVDPAQISASCSPGGVLEVTGGGSPHVKLVVDGPAQSVPGDGWSRLAPNLLIKDD
jgi:hypothetical protein